MTPDDKMKDDSAAFGDEKVIDEENNQTGFRSNNGSTAIEEIPTTQFLRFWRQKGTRISLKSLSYTLTVLIALFIIGISTLIAKDFNDLAKSAERAKNISIPQALQLNSQALLSDRLRNTADEISRSGDTDIRDAYYHSALETVQQLLTEVQERDSMAKRSYERLEQLFRRLFQQVETLNRRNIQRNRVILQTTSSLIDVNIFIDGFVGNDSAILEIDKVNGDEKAILSALRIQGILNELQASLQTLKSSNRYYDILDMETSYNRYIATADYYLQNINSKNQGTLSQALEIFQQAGSLFDFQMRSITQATAIDQTVQQISINLEQVKGQLLRRAASLAANDVEYIAVKSKESLATSMGAFVVLGLVFILTGFAVQHEIVRPTLRASNALLKLSEKGSSIRLAYSDLKEIESINKGVLELAAALREKEEVNERLVAMAQMKTNLTSSVSHELRTPLTSIRGFVDLALRHFRRDFLPLANNEKLEKRGQRIENNLAVVLRESKRLGTLIDDILDIAKIESGRMVWRDANVTVAELFEHAHNAISGELALKPSVKLRVKLQKDLPVLHVDHDRMQQVLMNLLNNAIKFTDSGVIQLTAEQLDDNLIIKVIDEGVGVPTEDLELIFEKFRQTSHQETLINKPKGTGLGLAICKQIVEHYGGAITVESALKQGSTFKIKLPF